MRRRVITVPKDAKASHALDYDNANPEHLIELNLTHKEFMKLYNDNFFNYLNNVCNVNIDDHESEVIDDREAIKLILENYKGNTDMLYFSILNLFKEALNRSTSIHFHF